jgi:peptidoglycan hydrolase CwlO-like protein
MFLVMKEGIRAQDAKQNSRLDALEQENKALRSELDELKEQVRKILKKKED